MKKKFSRMLNPHDGKYRAHTQVHKLKKHKKINYMRDVELSEEKEKAIFKFNNGNGAMLCSGCYVILKTGYEYNEKEELASRGKFFLEPQYCEECKLKNNE